MEPITRSPMPTPANGVAPVKKTMNLGEALSETARGEKITRVEWADKEIYGYLVKAELRLHRNGKDNHWVISEGDIISTDFIIV